MAEGMVVVVPPKLGNRMARTSSTGPWACHPMLEMDTSCEVWWMTLLARHPMVPLALELLVA